MAKNHVMLNGQKITTYNNNPKLKAANNPIQYTKEQLEEYFKCASDIEYFCEKYVKIISLDEGVIGFNMRDYQKEMVKLYSQERFTITLASRQIGKCLSNKEKIKIKNKITGTLGYAAANGVFDKKKKDDRSSLNSLSEIQIPNLSIPQSKMIINPNGNSLTMDYLTGRVSPQVNPFMQYRPKGL